MTSDSTQDRILGYLHKVNHATVAEISRALDITPADVRYHFRHLWAENKITSLPGGQRRKSPVRGRPARRFCLASSARQDNLQKLLEASLTMLIENGEDADILDKTFSRLAELLAPLPSNLPASGSLRLNALVEWLNANQYQAHWEARTGGPCVIFANCPYLKILAQFPQLCQLDKTILSQHLNSEVHIIQTISPAGTEVAQCQFKTFL